jgi:hypothetical protein
MSPRVYLDLTAGVGGLPLYWTSGGQVRPVVSRIGNKWGYAGAICRIRGLSWRRPPEVLLLNDADPEIAGLWRCLLDPEIARAAAAKIRGWSEEEPRPLWDRLRARLSSGELSPPSVEWAASRMWVERRTVPGAAAAPMAYNYLPPTNPDGQSKRWRPEAPAPRIEALAEWAASWSWVCGNSWRGELDGGWKPLPTNSPTTTCNITPERAAARIESTPTPGAVALNARAEEIPVPADARGWLVYADPPYQGTTGYRCEWPRADVLEVARRWADAGASVMLSEAEPLDLPGWHHVEITALRTGQARTFSKQQREFLTLSERPAWRPPVQRSLFAVGAL